MHTDGIQRDGFYVVSLINDRKEEIIMEKTLRYGVIGAGVFAGIHMSQLSVMPNTKVMAICDKHIESAKELAAKYGVANVYDDYNKMLERDDIDCVAVVTADKAHKDATVAALRAGKHVLCEKPMSLFIDECKEMIKTAEETGKVLMVGQICRFAPGFVKAKELVDSGVIGELFYVESEYAHDYAKIPGVDGWRADADRDPIIGGACHAIDLLRWIAGDPAEVTAYSNHKVLRDWPVNDCTVSLFKFPNDVIGKVFTSIGCKRNYTMRTVLYGDKGTIVVNNTDPVLKLYLERENENSAEIDPNLYDHTVGHDIEVSVNNHNVRGEHEGFRATILENAPLLMTGKEGAKTVAVCCAVVESAKSGQAVKVDYEALEK